MEKPLITFNISSRQELDEIINQYSNGGKALLAMWDYQQVLRDARKHGEEAYYDAIRKELSDEHKNVDDDILSDIAATCQQYFESKYYETKRDNGVEDD